MLWKPFGFDFLSGLWEAVQGPLFIIAVIAYVTARLILIYLTAQSFSDLLQKDEKAFTALWNTDIPGETAPYGKLIFEL